MTFLTEEQIISDLLLVKLAEQDKREIKKTAEADLIMYHHGFGRWIRNTYGLWDPKNPYVDFNDPMGDNHPDQMSQRIIETVWKRLQ